MSHVPKLVCECGHMFTADQWLVCKNPFNPMLDMRACPHCKDPSSEVLEACQHDLCWEPVTAGTPTTDGGYKRHCYRHPPANAGRWYDRPSGPVGAV